MPPAWNTDNVQETPANLSLEELHDMRKLVCLVGLFSLSCLTAAAQESRTTKDVSLEYSYIRANPQTSGLSNYNVNGGTASLAINSRTWIGIDGEFSGYHVGQVGGTSVNSELLTYMIGPQVYVHHFSHFTPFVQGLFGAAHSTGAGFGTPTTRDSFAMATGGGVDIPYTKHVSLRLGPVDYLLTNFAELPGAGRRRQDNLRLNAGLRWRF